jgi:murein DD-endopeptidase MepM/ murein hydrolase activator NlpD
MGKKHLSLIIVPHNKSDYRTLSFSKRFLKNTRGAAIIVGVLLLVGVADYIRIRSSGSGYKNLAAENAKQKERLSEYEAAIPNLEKRIKDLDEYRKKINLLAGVRSPDELKEVGGGGRSYTPPDGQVIPGVPPSVAPGSLKSVELKADDVKKNLEMLGTLFQNDTAKWATTPSIYPTAGLLTSYFGWRADPFTGKQQFHLGLDIATVLGNPVVATADGTVIATNADQGLGRSVQISHGLGLLTVYGHLNNFNCRVGQKVKRGDVIGEVGNSGRAVGPHVHYEVKVNGTNVNPLSYIFE